MFYNIERRRYLRYLLSIAVSIYHDDKFVGTRVTQNIGAGGLLIKTDDLGLCVNNLITIQFDIPKNNGIIHLSIPSIISKIYPDYLLASLEKQEEETENLICEHLRSYLYDVQFSNILYAPTH